MTGRSGSSSNNKKLFETVGSFLARRCGYADLKAAYADMAKKPICRLFVLGGNNGEMEVIKTLLAQAGQRFVQPRREWGNHRYSLYDLGVEVKDGLADHFYGYIEHEYSCIDFDELVFVECCLDDERFCFLNKLMTPVVVVDHHGKLAGKPASVRQIFDILEADGRTPSNELRRWVELVGANDAGYIPAMVAVGATPDEIRRIRALDRSAQGVTPAHEIEAERAIAAKEVVGRLTIVRMSHSKTATVTDRLFGRYDQLLILSGDGESNLFGDGALCAELKMRFDGWSGGSGLGKPGEYAYWGGDPRQDMVTNFIRQKLNK